MTAVHAQECPSIGLAWSSECGWLCSILLAGFRTSDHSSAH